MDENLGHLPLVVPDGELTGNDRTAAWAPAVEPLRLPLGAMPGKWASTMALVVASLPLTPRLTDGFG